MDIFNLTKSETRKAILSLYFAHPERKYYLRELERILHLPVQNIRRELVSLEKNGIFKREKIGNQVYYFLDSKSPIYDEIKKIVLKTIGIERELKEALKDFKDVRAAFIFGSYAQGTEDSMSDVDLMIVGEIDEDELINKISILEKKIDREINYHIFSESEFATRKKEGEVFIKGILSKPNIFLVGTNEDI